MEVLMEDLKSWLMSVIHGGF